MNDRKEVLGAGRFCIIVKFKIRVAILEYWNVEQLSKVYHFTWTSFQGSIIEYNQANIIKLVRKRYENLRN